MIISNYTEDTNGDLKFDFNISKEEASYLISMAIQILIKQGIISMSHTEEDKEVQIFKSNGGRLS